MIPKNLRPPLAYRLLSFLTLLTLLLHQSFNLCSQVMFKCPVRKSVRPVQVVEQGKIKRVRGVAWAVRVSPAVANRLVETAKGELLRFLPDVYIYTDHWAGARAGNSPGFGLTLTAETTTGCFLTAEVRLGGG